MDQPGSEERAARIKHSRQVLAGGDLQPAEEPLGFGPQLLVSGSGEFRYLIGLAVLVVLAAIVFSIWGMGPASLILLILALGLLAGWFIL